MVLGRVQVLEIPMCCCLVTKSCLTLCDPMNCSTPGTVSRNFLKLMSIKSVMPSNHLVLSHPLLLPSIFPSHQGLRVFASELALPIRWRKYWNFSFSLSPSSEYSGLISSKVDWFDLLVQETFKSLLQHRN